MKIQLLRNATQLLSVNNKKLLIDPMFAGKGAYDSFPNTGNERRNPTVELPLSERELASLISQVDAVLLTHLHPDHWDEKAKALLSKSIPVICQPEDVSQLAIDGFKNLLPVENFIEWENISVYRTDGRHGTGEIGEKMGKVSGYVVEFGDERVYFAGDTIWCEEVKKALDQFHPGYVIVNGGGARFIVGDPIVMDIADVLAVAAYVNDARIYVVHLEAVNHSQENREYIRNSIESSGLSNCVSAPDDGEVFLH